MRDRKMTYFERIKFKAAIQAMTAKQRSYQLNYRKALALASSGKAPQDINYELAWCQSHMDLTSQEARQLHLAYAFARGVPRHVVEPGYKPVPHWVIAGINKALRGVLGYGAGYDSEKRIKEWCEAGDMQAMLRGQALAEERARVAAINRKIVERVLKEAESHPAMPLNRNNFVQGKWPASWFLCGYAAGGDEEKASSPRSLLAKLASMLGIM